MTVIPLADIQPLGRRFLVKPYKLPEKTVGGIYLPDSARDKRSWHYYEYLKGPRCRCDGNGTERCGWHGKDGLGVDPASLHHEAIFKTRFKVPAQALGVETEEGDPVMFLNSDEIEQVILWKP